MLQTGMDTYEPSTRALPRMGDDSVTVRVGTRTPTRIHTLHLNM